MFLPRLFLTAAAIYSLPTPHHSCPLSFLLSMPLYKPYVMEYGRVVWAWDSRMFWFG